MKRIIYICNILACFLFLLLSSGCMDNSQCYVIRMPINVQNFENIASVHVEVDYDPLVLTPVKVEKGKMFKDSDFVYGIDKPGRLLLGALCKEPVNGSGVFANIYFKSCASPDVYSEIALKNVVVYEADNREPIDIDLYFGMFEARSKTITAPSIFSLQMLSK